MGFDSMKLDSLLKKFNLKLDLSKELLQVDVEGEYTEVVKMKLFLDNPVHIKQEYDGYKFTGEDCECFLAPTNSVRTLSCHYKKENYTYGYSYDENGLITSIS